MLFLQSTFTAAISEPGAGDRELHDIFDYKKPRANASTRKSALLNLTDKQHDAMYALAGCHDVNYLISNVAQSTRDAMLQVGAWGSGVCWK